MDLLRFLEHPSFLLFRRFSHANIDRSLNRRRKLLKQSHWWKNYSPESTSTVKWTTLSHHGVIFPPPYSPHKIPIIYEGNPIILKPHQEEAATLWASVIGTQWETKETFRKNFERSFLETLGKRHKIKSLDKCDFSQIVEYLEKEKENKKNRTAEEKRAEKEEKLALYKKKGYAVVDGVKEKILNFVVEPPGLFRGRGDHPKAGLIKRRIMPEDVTINIGEDSKIPKCPVRGHKWGNIVHNHTVTWLAYYKDPILPNSFKYVWLAATSKMKGLNDMLKYEKARKLKEFIDKARESYWSKIKSRILLDRQLGSALYLIDKLALRVGNEKSNEEADTVGCCSLRVEHIKFEEDNKITLDFLAKDCMRYYNTIQIDPEVYKNLQDFTKNKDLDDDLFDLIRSNTLNDYLKSLMEGLSSKVFRTFNASIRLQEQLAIFNEKNLQLEDKMQFFIKANKEVALLCNHQKTVPKNFDNQLERINSQITKKKSKIENLENHAKELRKKKRLAKSENVKKRITTNIKNTKKMIEKVKDDIEKLETRIEMKEDTKNIALETSKINYIDPRIVVSWCKKNKVPLDKVYSKSLKEKFKWAMNTEPDWVF
ncbi:unnamed protein product [Blepharisma stoltei]|uniref:DNA topoisomerase 1 n=1 Tax=Blepharisma stoltei TaxID=1481888 RepID=A0AAU9JSB3_9CILI|nr:unnamed protein product [Blepharisma stoltei]